MFRTSKCQYSWQTWHWTLRIALYCNAFVQNCHVFFPSHVCRHLRIKHWLALFTSLLRSLSFDFYFQGEKRHEKREGAEKGDERKEISLTGFFLYLLSGHSGVVQWRVSEDETKLSSMRHNFRQNSLNLVFPLSDNAKISQVWKQLSLIPSPKNLTDGKIATKKMVKCWLLDIRFYGWTIPDNSIITD